MGLSQHNHSLLLLLQMAHTMYTYITHAAACDATMHVLDDAPLGLMSKLA